MISKCANPGCVNRFRYFHEGKLYHFEARPSSANHPEAYGGNSRAAEYYWLCSPCAAWLRLEQGEDTQPRMVPLFCELPGIKEPRQLASHLRVLLERRCA